MVEVPLHITNPPAIQRHVQVSGGTNWDLSRSAVQTPIKQLPDPVPVRIEQDSDWAKFSEVLPGYTSADSMPQSIPSISTFGAKQATVSKAATKALQSLSKKKTYVVVGHADDDEASPSKLSWSRANNVAAVLKRSVPTVRPAGLRVRRIVVLKCTALRTERPRRI
jgi:outer membrane protein OmpA-like peptidoglycan-associated protein